MCEKQPRSQGLFPGKDPGKGKDPGNEVGVKKLHVSCVKISCLRPKAKLVFHWCLYNN